MVATTNPTADPRRLPGRGLRELILVAVLYVAYSASRLLADGDVPSAVAHALRIEHLERTLGLHWEPWLNGLFTHHHVLALVSSYWYASAHYVVTVAVLIAIFYARPSLYRDLRNALVLATGIALAFYLLTPTAPPRMLPTFHDILASTSAQGWWGADASAPRGLGTLTNELAAFPSMHAGWALWVRLAVYRTTRSRPARAAASIYALGTAVVVIGTANHWVLDVVAGWIIIAVTYAVLQRRSRHAVAQRAPVGAVTSTGG